MIAHSLPLMTGPSRDDDPEPPGAEHPVGETLLSDEPTIELLVKARGGNREAVEALLQRCLPQLKRWAHGRLPPAARGSLDTGDLVQETVLHVLRRLDTFELAFRCCGLPLLAGTNPLVRAYSHGERTPSPKLQNTRHRFYG